MAAGPAPALLTPVLPPEYPSVPWRRVVRSALRVVQVPRPAEPRRCLLFAQGRTGSTLFGELLDSHPAIHFDHEILRAKVPSVRLWVAGERRRHPASVYGFHVKIYQLTDVQGIDDPATWLRQMAARGWRVLSLRRRNVLRHVLSNMAINATGVTHDRQGQGPTKLTVDPAELVHWIAIRTEVGRREAAALAGVEHEAFTYEDDLRDAASWPATAARAFRFLGLPDAPVETTLQRRNPGSVADLIANYDEVAAAVTAAGYAEFLD